jgi:hypothetical protein
MQQHIKTQRKASHLLNEKNKDGTKFKLFVQPRYVEGFDKPETIRISLKPNEVGKGPSDTRMYVVDPKDKLPYYEGCKYDPQFFDENGNNPKGNYFDPPIPNQGHYDEIDINSRQFSNTTMYATIRFVLDILESYLKPIKWVGGFKKLELIPYINWNNAHSGLGFIEFGFAQGSDGNIDKTKPYCENFDVLSHELGHNVIFSVVGFPDIGKETKEFWGFHESAGDLVSIISSLHFDTMVDKLLRNTKGNLFSFNILSDVGEVSKSKSIRHAFNNYKMSNVDQNRPHDLSEPLTGAFFDILVEVYQLYLVEDRLISEDLAKISFQDEKPDNLNDPVRIKIQEEFNSAYIGKEQEFKENLLRARDYLGNLIGDLWYKIDKNNLTYNKILRNVISIENNMAEKENRKTYEDLIIGCFEWREIRIKRNIHLMVYHKINNDI